MSKIRVLVADNSEEYRRSLVRVLESEDYEVIPASKPEEALDCLAKSLIHMAIVDVRLEEDEDGNDKSGLKVCAEMDSTIPRMIVTGFEGGRVVREAMKPSGAKQRPADGYFYKFDSPAEILSGIRSVLQAEYEIIPDCRLAVLTSGGDSPGMNAAIWAIVRTAMRKNIEVMAVQDGYRGLADDKIFKLRWNDVSDIMERGGTILGTARYPEFKDPDVRARAIQNLVRKHVSALIVIGGDGSMRGAHSLAEQMEKGGQKLQTLTLPGTIDNDMYGSDMSLGADSAVGATVNELRNMCKPAQALRRIFVVEVMGRHAGYLALQAALGIGADAALIPEEVVEFYSPDNGPPGENRVNLDATRDRFADQLSEVSAQMERAFVAGKRYGFVILAEGIGLLTGDNGKAKEAQEILSGKIERWSYPDRPDVRAQVLGYPVRGVAPSSFDVHLGAMLGEAAVLAIDRGDSAKMLGWVEGGGIQQTDYSQVVKMTNRTPKEVWQERRRWRELAALLRSLAQPPQSPF